MRSVLGFAVDLLLPRVCLACPAPARRELSLCPDCHRLLEPPPGGAAAGGRLEGCDAFFWLWAYQPPIDRVILGLKHQRLDYLGRHIAAEAIATLGIKLRRAELIVPMPMHWRRRLVRGRNHAESIARPLAAQLERRLRPVLRRRALGRPQVGRSRRQRLANPDVAFHCHRPDEVHDRVVLLVDDVVTTGATAGRAARCLRAAGAAEVIVFVPARTPDPAPDSSAIVNG
ncbi:MAG: phosphoribosyltransferase family protein [Acidobacteria bacterium]|nr:phosphoribosyltransferase family protein [Acidobacteriota bacterium]